MLILSRRVNESIVIGETIEVSVVEIRGDQVKLGIVAPRDVTVHRKEVFDAIQTENRAAALASTTDLDSLSGLVSRPNTDSDSGSAGGVTPDPENPQ